MTKKMWIIFVGIVLVIIGGLFYASISSQEKTDVSGIDKYATFKPLAASAQNGDIGDHVLGNKNAKVVLLEYGDYQCPGCRTAAPAAKRVSEKYGDKVALVFRNYPLPQLHPNARSAASVAEAAGLQDKFWQMHDLLYESQAEWRDAGLKDRDELFISYAKELKLDEQKFKEDIASARIKKKLSFDIAVGKMQEVTATPTIFLNGKKIDLADENSIEDVVKTALEK